MVDMNKRPVANKKIKNATKCELDGIKFDSRLEMYCYGQLKLHNIPFELKPKYILQDKFRYNREAVRQITYTSDFLIINKGVIVDTKGFKTNEFNLKLKILKHNLYKAGFCYEIALPKNQKEVNALINKIKLH